MKKVISKVKFQCDDGTDSVYVGDIGVVKEERVGDGTTHYNILFSHSRLVWLTEFEVEVLDEK